MFHIPHRVLEIPGVEKHTVLELLLSQRSQYSGRDAWDDKESRRVWYLSQPKPLVLKRPPDGEPLFLEGSTEGILGWYQASRVQGFC